ncbi:MAG: NUDIX hydrolase [Chloroflexi bacterium]|nr:NUDIX hydrolase [Chloroflexota bacterium]
MSHDLPTITTHDGRRQFACTPTALVCFVVNTEEQILFLSHPNSGGRWEVINGALEHGETLLEGCLREIGEEAGPEIQVRPLSVLHAYSFAYDAAVSHMTSLCFVFGYEGGAVIPGDDMAGSGVRWASVDEITRGEVDVIVPRQVPWLFARAVEHYRLYKDRAPAMFQPPMGRDPHPKYPKQTAAERNANNPASGGR